MPAAVWIPIVISAAGTGVQFLMRPKIKGQKTDKGKFDDVRVTGSDYGAFIPRGWGIYRIGGNIVFSNGVQTYTQTSTTGSKKTGRNTETTYTYKTSAGVLVCRPHDIDVGVTEFRRIWADSTVVYNSTEADPVSARFEAEAGTLTGTAASSVSATASGGHYVSGLATGSVTIDTSSVEDPDTAGDNVFPHSSILVRYKCTGTQTVTIVTVDPIYGTVTHSFTFPASTGWTMKTCLVNGWATSVKIQNSDIDVDRIDLVKIYDIIPPKGVQVTGAADPTVDYPTDILDPAGYYNYSPTADSAGQSNITTTVPSEQIRFYTGTQDQDQDSTIEAWLDSKYGTGQGVLRTSAMRALAYVMFQDRTLANGRLENFTFELQDGDAYLNTIVADLLEDVGITDYDLSATSDTSTYAVIGFMETSAGSRKSLLEHLQRYFQVHLAEIDGTVVTIPDGYNSLVSLTSSQVRAHDYTEEMPVADAEAVIKEEHIDAPREVIFNVLNPDLDYHNEPFSSALFTTSSTRTDEFNFPIVDKGSRPKERAERHLLKANIENMDVTIYPMPELAKHSVGDVVTEPTYGTVRIEKITRSLPVGKIKWDCVKTGYVYSGAQFQNTVTASAPKLLAEQAVKAQYPRNSVVVPIQSIPIHDKDDGKLGVYLGISNIGRGASGRMALYKEVADNNFEKVATVDAPTPMGMTDGLFVSDTPTLVAHDVKRGTLSTGVTSNTIDTTGATLIVVALGRANSGTGTTLTDSKGNTWTPLTAKSTPSNTAVQLFYAQNPVVGTGHTFTVSGTGIYPSISVSAWSGTATSSVFDVENGATTNSATSLQTGSVTPSQDNSLIVTACSASNNRTFTIDSSFTHGDSINTSGNWGVDFGYLVETTATAKNPTWTANSSTDIAAAIAVFKPGPPHIDIQFFDDVSLESVTDADIAANPTVNLIRIGDEWVQYKTATALTLDDNSPYRSKWRISDLTRGCFGTSGASHTADAVLGGEYASIASGLLFYEMDASDVGATVNFKAVTSGQDPDIAFSNSFTFNPPSSGYVIATAGESLTKGQWVSIYNASGVLKVRKANATDATKPCHGFIERDASSGDKIAVCTREGMVNRNCSGLTIGDRLFLSTTGGASTSTAPATSGNIVQPIAIALSATEAVFKGTDWTVV